MYHLHIWALLNPSMANIHNREVYKQGFFIKSPPPHLFNNQSSWKRRYFILSKSTSHGYLLSYLKGQQIKGHIEINDKEVEEWATFLFTLCSEKKKLEPRNRSKSSPACLDQKKLQLGAFATTKVEGCADPEYEEIAASVFNKRPSSYPTQDISKDLLIYESPRKLFLQLQEKFPDGFKTPGGSTASDDEKISNTKEYMSMGDLFSELVEDKNQPVCTSNDLLTLPTSQVDEQVAEDYPQKPKPLPTIFKEGGKSKLSLLSEVQLSIILSKISDDTYLKQVDVHLPPNDLTHYLTLVKASGCICVSQWKDPHHLGCIFHQGDYIVAVNDLHIKDMDEIFMFISRSTRREVKLTLKRLPDSNVLHTPGCNCV